MLFVVRVICLRSSLQKRFSIEDFYTRTMRQACISKIIAHNLFFVSFFKLKYTCFYSFVKQKWIIGSSADYSFAFYFCNQVAETLKDVIQIARKAFKIIFITDFLQYRIRSLIGSNKIPVCLNFMHSRKNPRKHRFAA